MRHPNLAVFFGISLAVGLATTASATDGYFADGFGTQSKGMAGVGLAYPKDSLAIANNPAAATVIGNRFDADMDYFLPSRSASITGNAFGANQSYSGNDSPGFLIPELGYVRQINDKLALGLAIYGNGGMDTAYTYNPYARFGAIGKAGIDLQQLFLSPTVAYRVADGQNIGLSLNIVDQRFKAQGIGAFGGFSSNPTAVSNQGRDSSFGYGVRLGWLGSLTPWLSAGASWQSTTYSGEFSKYKGLFADHGGFDVPASYGLGIVVKPSSVLDIPLDIKRILYSDVRSVGDNFQSLLSGRLLGSTGGPGFGWRDTTSVKIGVNYQFAPAWQVRAGYGYTTEPIPANQTFLNILAPGTIQHQVTVGGSWQATKSVEISLFGLYALPQTVRGSGSIPPGFPPGGFGGGEANIKLSELSYGVGFGWKF